MIAFSAAFAKLLMGTGVVTSQDEVTDETLDKALRAYINRILDERENDGGISHD